MRDVVLITNYWHFDCEKASARYTTLANMIVSSGMNLEVITSSFYHGTKKQRNYDDTFLNGFPFKVTLEYEPGYPKNVCLKRFWSQRIFAKNVVNYLKRRKKPDVIYCVIPSTDVAYQVSTYAKRNGIEFILDIQDLWPEAFKLVVNIPVLSDLLFYPIQRKANIAYSRANKIVAVSESYVNRAKSKNTIYKCAAPVYLGIELSEFNKMANERPHIRKSGDGFWLAYIGTLGHSYDIKCVIRAIRELKNRNIQEVFFYVMGYGPLEEEFKAFAEKEQVSENVIFTGRLTYKDMVQLLCECDVAINPIVHNAAQSITNKHGDYFASGLPMLSTQESTEIKDLLEKYNAGINCANGDEVDLANKILMLKENKELCQTMGNNSAALAATLFDRKKTYQQIVGMLR